MRVTARTPEPPYYAVIFTSARISVEEGYAAMAERMVELAHEQPGFLGVETVHDDTLGITVSYWESLDAVAAWKANAEHRVAQEKGRSEWYREFSLRVAWVERAYEFLADGPS